MAETTTSKPLFSHYGLDFGSGHIPVVMVQDQLQPDLIDYLQTNVPAFHACEHELTEAEAAKLGYVRCVDHPHVPGHMYYEAYYHGLYGRGGQVRSINPRYGKDSLKAAAPRPLRAYVEAYRRKNAAVFGEIARRFRTLDPGKYREGTRLVAEGLAKLIETGRHFSDLAVQMHYADGVVGADATMHSDAPNSILHLATSIRGRRVLITVLCPADEETGACVTKKRGEVLFEQPERDIYLSSPYAFKHGVEYPECTWANRIIAVQSRFLFTEEDLSVIYGRMDCAMDDVMVVVSTVLAEQRANLQVPTLADVIEVERGMEDDMADETIPQRGGEDGKGKATVNMWKKKCVIS